MKTGQYDVIFAGGGLSSGLVAYRFACLWPNLSIAIVEAGQRIGGNHTWSFHTSDVSHSEYEWLSPFISHKWAHQSVRFPAHARTLRTGYNSISAETFEKVVRRMPSISVLCERPVVEVSPTSVTLEGGLQMSAKVVFDGRGPLATSALEMGFQKFLGQEIRFTQPHGLTAPIIMDATVPQTDGYRFVYVLPFTATSALIEDTYYADGTELPLETLRDEIAAYALHQGWHVDQVLREEKGILPILLDGRFTQYWAAFKGKAPPIGLRAGLFHPVTGYSVPEAVALADLLVGQPLSPPAMFSAIQGYAQTRWKAHSFYRMLNRMLFKAAEPDQRYRVLQRFYTLPESLIERFYAGNNMWQDKIRILAGKPPVPILNALKALPARHRGHAIDEGQLG